MKRKFSYQSTSCVPENAEQAGREVENTGRGASGQERAGGGHDWPQCTHSTLGRSRVCSHRQETQIALVIMSLFVWVVKKLR